MTAEQAASAAKLLTKDEADRGERSQIAAAIREGQLPHGQLLAYEGALGNSTSRIELSILS